MLDEAFFPALQEIQQIYLDPGFHSGRIRPPNAHRTLGGKALRM
jgi:hypothetical protein